MKKVEMYKFLSSLNEEDKKQIYKELSLEYDKPKPLHCTKCGQRFFGDNDGLILGIYTFLAPDCDFTKDNPLGDYKTKVKYESIKTHQKNVLRTLSAIRKLLEDYDWTGGKYYRKICKTEDYAHSFLKTLEKNIEGGHDNYFDELSPSNLTFEDTQKE